MVFENRTITGTNAVPVASHRAHRFGHFNQPESVTESTSRLDALAEAATAHNQSTKADGDGDGRGRSAIRHVDEPVKQRKRGNRWAKEDESNTAAGLIGLPTAILGNMTAEQLEAYTLHLRIEEISQKIRIGDVVPHSRIRSPSPPPTYDSHGVRSNTREQRYRRRLEAERHKLIERASKIIPNYRAPTDYRRPTKTHEKIYVPVNDYPEINFIGLLIGPRGNTLKDMELKSGARIAIRGKGSVKEGKGGSDRANYSNLDEDLHCLIIADTEMKINKAKALINSIIETAASVPERNNELKMNQLRMLATLNGTLRDDENQICQNCGGLGHRKYECPEEKKTNANVICHACGNYGHLARDCHERSRGSNWRAGQQDVVDQEYEHLMNELSGNGAASLDYSQSNGAIETGDISQFRSTPWDRPREGAAPWQRTNTDTHFARSNDKVNQPWRQPPSAGLVGTGTPVQPTQLLSALPNVAGAPGTGPYSTNLNLNISMQAPSGMASSYGVTTHPPPPPAWTPSKWTTPAPWNIPPPPLGEVPPPPPPPPESDVPPPPPSPMPYGEDEGQRKKARLSGGK